MADVDRDAYLSAAARIEASGEVTPDDIRALARSLLSIAEVAMPASFYDTDSRCRLARAVIAAGSSPEPTETATLAEPPEEETECPDCFCCTRGQCDRRSCASGSCPCTEY